MSLHASPACEQCAFHGTRVTEGVALESSRTAYHHPLVCEVHEDCIANEELGRACQATKSDPNAPLALCRPCAEEHHANWDERWAEYQAGLL